jgi:hypothetical protein
MDSIIAYRNDQPATNDYPRRIVSPTTPSACCMQCMERIGRSAVDAAWRFYYKRCAVCGYTVRCFYAPSILAILEAAKQIKLTLAEMNLGAGKRKRRTQAEIEEEIAAAAKYPLGTPPPQPKRARRSLMPLRPRRPIPSPA